MKTERLHNSQYWRKLTACTLAAGLLTGNVFAGVPKRQPGGNVYSPYAAYPNIYAVQNGYYLEGVNVEPPHDGSPVPATPPRAVLRFILGANDSFKQLNNDPADGDCNWDQENWQPGPSGNLEYTQTHIGCGATINNEPVTLDYIYGGIQFMPKTYSTRQKWHVHGVSTAKYEINNQIACEGKNVWNSKAMGERTLPDGSKAVWFHTTEIQDWQQVPGGPPADLCPPGKNGSYEWDENYYIRKALPVEQNGSVTAFLPGVAVSRGGNRIISRHSTRWNVQLSSYQQASTPVIVRCGVRP